MGSLDPGYVEKVAAVRNGRGTALALIVDAAAWPGPRTTPKDTARLDAGAAVLAAAGWRVVVCGPGQDLAVAWRALARGHGPARTTSFTSELTP
jgi:hypothetical protein